MVLPITIFFAAGKNTISQKPEQKIRQFRSHISKQPSWRADSIRGRSPISGSGGNIREDRVSIESRKT